MNLENAILLDIFFRTTGYYSDETLLPKTKIYNYTP